jgi:hypothetical protein
LALSAVAHVEQLTRGRFDHGVVVGRADALRRSLFLPTTALDATLLALAWSKHNDDAFFVPFGDGAFVSKRSDGIIRYDHISFSKNAPQYLSYLLSSHRAAAFDALEQTQTRVRPDSMDQLAPFPAVASTSVMSWPQPIWVPPDGTALVTTDGMDSFHRSDGTPIPFLEVASELLAFKGYAGRFVQRRARSFLDRFCAETGWTHADDFAVAGIHFG